jgi:LmbE family N-acetylglucosaminyl deacetylase
MEVDRVLFISPHTDDAELGAGGTIARFIEEGKEVYYLVFSSCEASIDAEFPPNTLVNECTNSCRALHIQPNRIKLLDYEVRTFPLFRQQILDDLIKVKNEVKPDLVFVPSSSDTHQDHRTIYWEALRAFKKETSIWGYEHPWNNLTFTTDIFIRLEAKHFQKKLEALKQYKSQNGRSYFDEDYLRSLALTRGVQIDWEYAEAFELIRLLV